jgi:hypothetical protein
MSEMKEGLFIVAEDSEADFRVQPIFRTTSGYMPLNEFIFFQGTYLDDRTAEFTEPEFQTASDPSFSSRASGPPMRKLLNICYSLVNLRGRRIDENLVSDFAGIHSVSFCCGCLLAQAVSFST